jgi:hypothetical protein
MPDFGIMRGFNEKLFGDKLVAGQLPTQLGLIGSFNVSPLLLDTYPSAAAAYSVRLLKSDYTGNAIRVRRSSDNAEQNIGFDGSGNLDTTALTSFCSGTNGFVTTWYDQSGNGLNLTQSTAGNQPQIVSNGTVVTQNSKPTLLSPNSSYRFLNTAFGVSLSNPQIFNVSLITNAVTAGYTGHFIDLGNASTVENHFISGSGDTGSYTDVFSNTRLKYGTFNANLNQQYLECYESVSGTTTRYLNTTDRGSNTYTVTTPNNLKIGGSVTSNPAYGNIQEVVIYATGNSSNRTGIETNINTYYAIY